MVRYSSYVLNNKLKSIIQAMSRLKFIIQMPDNSL